LNRVNICNVLIDNVTSEEVLEKIELLVCNRKPQYLVTPNVDHIVKLQSDSDFKEIYNEANLVLADGMPLLWAAIFLGTPLKEKNSGSDIFPKICKFSVEKGYKLFFLGGRHGAAEQAAEVLKKQYNGLNIVGIYSPPFGFEDNLEENGKIVAMIKGSSPDILFVGLGAPKQEKWIFKYKEQYQVPVSIGIGVTFEFIAGMVKRAPLWMQKIGFEWFWRVIIEPKRLWRRYFVDDMKIFGLVCKQKRDSLYVKIKKAVKCIK